MRRFSESLASGKFLVTSDLAHPEGADTGPVLRAVMTLRTRVDAFHLTRPDNPLLTATPMSLAHHLLGKGVEPILQFTSTARGPVELQNELLNTFALGIKNLLFVDEGPSPDKFRIATDALGLVESATGLNLLMTRGPRRRAVDPFCIGVTVDPDAADLENEARRMERMVEAGASFFQARPTFHPEGFARFMFLAGNLDAPVLTSVVPLRSASMARGFQELMPRAHIPEEMVQEMEEATNPEQTGIEIAARLIRELRDVCRGVRVMAARWEDNITKVLAESGLARPRRWS